MIGTSNRIWSWSSVTLVGVLLGLAGAQPALAEMTRPNMETGGSGAEATTLTQPDGSSETWGYELPYEQGRPVLVAQANEDVRVANAAYQNQRSIMLIEGKEAPAVAEQESSSVSTRTTSDRSIALIESKEAPVEVAQSAAEGGYHAIVDDEGNAVVPELVAAGSTERIASAGSAFPRMICVTCATFR